MRRTDGSRRRAFKPVYIAQTDYTDVPKAERTGCWSIDFPAVLARKTAYYQQIALNDWTRNVEGAVEAGVPAGRGRGNDGATPAHARVLRGHRSESRRHEADALRSGEDAGRDNRILDVMRSWTGPRNRKGKPKVSALSEGSRVLVTREAAKRALGHVRGPGETRMTDAGLIILGLLGISALLICSFFLR